MFLRLVEPQGTTVGQDRGQLMPQKLSRIGLKFVAEDFRASVQVITQTISKLSLFD